MKKQQRQHYIVRTTSLPAEVNEHISNRIKNRTFKEYFVELIEKDMQEEILLNNTEKTIIRIEEMIKGEFSKLNEKIKELEKAINERSFIEVKEEMKQEQQNDIVEGQIVDVNIVTKGEIDTSEFEFDF
ncbi:hypothetical protein [Calidifontibacillus erzurumensis]|uniref:hypothetical protein n=1 Tax=Calidifontibacillus erzurumensis TaxID=2741433 RepID=UPI0035B54E4D